jgi:hypothetical protein
MRLGVVLQDTSRVFASHPGPGEIAATVGPGPEDLAPFLHFLAAGLLGGARFAAHGERFAAIRRDDALVIRQVAPEGDLEDEIRISLEIMSSLAEDRAVLRLLTSIAPLQGADLALDAVLNARNVTR